MKSLKKLLPKRWKTHFTRDGALYISGKLGAVRTAFLKNGDLAVTPIPESAPTTKYIYISESLGRRLVPKDRTSAQVTLVWVKDCYILRLKSEESSPSSPESLCSSSPTPTESPAAEPSESPKA